MLFFYENLLKSLVLLVSQSPETMCVFCVYRSADIFSKHMKWILVGLYVCGCACFVLFALSLISVLPDTTGTIQ